jgi:hypothetical protein
MGHSRNIIRLTLVLFIIACILLFGFWISTQIPTGPGWSSFPIAWCIAIAAVLGSLVNQPFRDGIENQNADFSPSIGTESWIYYIFWMLGYLLWKCSVAIVFAFLFYLITAGGLIAGDLFPEFSAGALPQGKTWNIEYFVKLVDPKSPYDIAKLLVWSFAAGYSERLVPNLLDKLTDNLHQSRSSE